MTPQAKQDAKKLWKAAYANSCLSQSAKAAKYILDGGVNYQDPLYLPLMNAAFVLYARPFIESDGVGKLSDKMVPEELFKVHEDALRIRHQLAAHRDSAPSVLPSGIPSPHLRVMCDGKSAQIDMSEVLLNDYKFKWLLKLIEGVANNLNVEVERIMSTYLPEIPGAGQYIVNITDSSGPFFVPA